MSGISRALRFETFGGPESLRLQETAEPHVGHGQIRVRIRANGLNPMDWYMTSDAETAQRFKLTLPCGFGTDYAGVVDEVGPGVTAYAIGDRVYGTALSRAVADHLVIDAHGTIATSVAHHTPEGLDDRTAAVLPIAASTALAAVARVNPGPDDTVLIGGAGGGVGLFAVQLARLAGARVIGTGSASSADYLRSLGAEPVVYGDGLADRVRRMGAPTAALDLHGSDTVHAARELGVTDSRICMIAGVVPGVQTANGASAGPEALQSLARRVAAGEITVPLAATFPLEEFRAAIEMQAGRHVRGKVVIEVSGA